MNITSMMEISAIKSMMEISAKLYPNKNIYSLSKEEKQKVLQVYYDNN